MAKIIIPPIIPGHLSSQRFARNGDMPTAAGLRRIAWAYNHAATHQRKVLFCQSYDTQGTYAPTGTSESTIYFAFRTGENVESVAFMCGMAPANAASGTNQGSMRLNLYDGSSTLSSAYKYYPQVGPSAYVPNDVAWVWGNINVDDHGLQANTQYSGYVNQYHYARIHSLIVYETAPKVGVSSVTGVVNTLDFEGNKPIYDARIQGLVQTGTTLWRHNGSQLISWGRESSATPPTINTASWANILKTASSTYDATAPGFSLQTQYHDSLKRDIPVEFAARIRRTFGTGDLNMKLENASGTVFSTTFSGSGTNPYHVATGTISAAAAAKTDIMAQCSDGSTTYEIDAVGLWEYEA